MGQKKKEEILRADTLAIKIRQWKLGVTNREIAWAMGVTEQFVGQIINGSNSSKDRRIERYLARRLNAPVEKLFPRCRSSQAA